MEKYAGDGLYLVGTAHISPRSVEEARGSILARRPRLVGVELCRPRMDALADRKRWERMSMLDVLRSGKGFLLLAQIYLSMTQRRLGKEYGVEPGSEMLAAVDAAREVGADVVLLDREITITFKRAWSEMGFREKLRLFWFSTKALVGYDGEEELEELDLDAIMEEDTLTAMLEEVRGIAPSATHVLLDERDETLAIRARLAMSAKGKKEWVKSGGDKDRWLTGKEIPKVKVIPLRESDDDGGGKEKRKKGENAKKVAEKGKAKKEEKAEKMGKGETKGKAGKIGKGTGKDKKAGKKSAPPPDVKDGEPADMVAIVGAGHVKGLTRAVKKKRGTTAARERLKALESVREKKWPWYRVLGYAIIGATFALFIWLAWFGEWEQVRNLIILWFLFNGICSGVAVLLVRGHPLSAGAAFVAAPITSLNPSVGAGWVAGIVEAKVRTPTVADMKALGKLENMKDFFDNRAIRVLMVAALGNVGSTIGTILFWAYVLGELPSFF